MGDPAGIGPEVIVKSLARDDLRNSARYLLFGLEQPLAAAATLAGIEPFWSPRVAPSAIGVQLIDEIGGSSPEPDSAESGELSFRFLRDAVDAAMTESETAAQAIVTGPISKRAWSLAGHDYPGHTEYLAERLSDDSDAYAMMFLAPTLRVVLVTSHVPLAEVPGSLTTDLIYQRITLGADACRRLGVESPRVAVCGLNPHAGEDRLLGDEDVDIIAPAIERARAEGVTATGPHPADTIFGQAFAGRYDLVVAMYHDQGLIPIKLQDRDRAVNFTAGLPVPRTSPDHGTAFDIAGKNLANPGSMAAAIELALKLARAGNSSPAAPVT
jgi:4-hydroxythreonine-4-phosphate dehydrogenase